VRNVRRALLGLGLGIAVLGPTLACSGTTGEPADPAKDAPAPAPAPPDPAKKIVGKWRMGIDESQQRRYKVIDAALAKGDGKKERLGDLSGEEQRLFDEWDAKDKKSPEVKAMRQEIRLTRGSRFNFTDTSVSADFGGEDAFENVPYKVVSATDQQITLSFDPGLGNGTETHVITWNSDSAGVDNITGADGKTFLPLDILRLK
jgi:hypothetical protein